MKKIEIYTDGACSGNLGIGGWAAILTYEKNRKEICGWEAETTNNRMELLAPIKALSYLPEKEFEIIIYTDSMYVKNGITKWIESWRGNKWKGSNKKPIKNIDLWKQLDLLNSQYKPKWVWVKGHSNNEYNNMVDSLAVVARVYRKNIS